MKAGSGWNRWRELNSAISASASFSIIDSLNDGVVNESILVSFVNPYSHQQLTSSSTDLKRFIFLVDGILLCILHQVFHRKKIERQSFDFSSLAPDVFSVCEARGISIALVGGSASEVEQSSKNVVNSYPALKMKYAMSGFFGTSDDYSKAIRFLSRSSCQVVICGMGTPRQEQFLVDLVDSGWKGIGITCGGFITQTSAGLSFYPKLINKLGARALYRFYKQPHVRKRVLVDYPAFLLRYTYNALLSIFLR